MLEALFSRGHTLQKIVIKPTFFAFGRVVSLKSLFISTLKGIKPAILALPLGEVPPSTFVYLEKQPAERNILARNTPSIIYKLQFMQKISTFARKTE